MSTLFQHLKKYSTIPPQFIDEFLGIQSTTNSGYLFRIDLDIVSRWLGARKGNLKNTLLTTYCEGIDYTITTLHSKRKGRPREQILLTADCFERVCMLSKSPMSKKVRSYYIQLENLMEMQITLPPIR